MNISYLKTIDYNEKIIIIKNKEKIVLQSTEPKCNESENSSFKSKSEKRILFEINKALVSIMVLLSDGSQGRLQGGWGIRGATAPPPPSGCNPESAPDGSTD